VKNEAAQQCEHDDMHAEPQHESGRAKDMHVMNEQLVGQEIVEGGDTALQQGTREQDQLGMGVSVLPGQLFLEVHVQQGAREALGAEHHPHVGVFCLRYEVVERISCALGVALYI